MRRFADVLLKHYKPGDVVWVQDYHLMLLPQLLKQSQPKMKVLMACQLVYLLILELLKLWSPCRCMERPVTTPLQLLGLHMAAHTLVLALSSDLRAAVVPQIGWFLHTPFPSSEMYRTLPVREELLRAVLKADLIGFHTYDYARHFVSACTRILGLEVPPSRQCAVCKRSRRVHSTAAA